MASGKTRTMKGEVIGKSVLASLTASDALAIVAASADVALLLDREGNVIESRSDAPEPGAALVAGWVGNALTRLVTVESRAKIDAMLAEAFAHGSTRWRQVNHPLAESASDLPVQYRMVRLDGRELVLAVGREMRSVSLMQQRLVNAQQHLEREYRELRHSDLRYRMLFQLATDAVLIVDLQSRRITESNPAAVRLLGTSSGRLNGRAFPLGISEPDDRDLLAWLQRLQSGVDADEIRVVLRATGTQGVLTASLFREDRTPMALVRMRTVDASPGTLVVPTSRSVLLKAVEALIDGVVVTEADGRVVMANGAFLEMVQAPGLERVIGESIERWLGRPGVDIALLMVGVTEQGSVSLFSTILRSEFGSVRSVEVSATQIPGSDPARIAYAVRDTGLRVDGGGGQPSGLDRGSMEHLTELVGRVPLKEIVRETDDLIERMCIETALGLAGDNRAQAAEMLGLSRQSLYVKMRRFGLGDLDSNLRDD